MLKWVLIGLLFFSSGAISGNAIEHDWLSRAIYDQLHGNIPSEELTLPLILMSGHRVLDYIDGEYPLGSFYDQQVIINGAIVAVGYLLLGIKEQQDKFLYCTFWGVVIPDTILKSATHGYENHIHDLTFDEQVMLTGVCLFVIKVSW